MDALVLAWFIGWSLAALEFRLHEHREQTRPVREADDIALLMDQLTLEGQMQIDEQVRRRSELMGE